MPAIGRYQWDKIVPELDRLGMLTKLDSAILEGFCALYAEFVTTVQRGEPIKGALMGQLRFHAGELGLTPTSRARLMVPPGQEDDQAELFFH
jgi:phage terminase small subunit